jgi:uncharacterized protein YjbI with pentapeptide repeats
MTLDARELIERYEAGERDFRGADLTGAGLSGANLQGVDLRGADLSQAFLMCHSYCTSYNGL